ncbi:ATP-dependent zinc metalloprotease FtsH [uncultured Flavonifractor sp.]|uniref:ATP-dependent zinc metalloprotease FtsH n=1 Tax=Eubacteriales TaxID=186802 RepID=UPI0008207D14|nr:MULTISPECIES: ATP-dependent zinc metalloprotease FtsH [Oscillospiraceae]MCH1980656.1 ATP-dependent zinc metalloprotease FtsH [Lawsonibacter sp. OA9]MCU6702028.1 ATP-dependent zinc metalloprotease FtsH [Muriventricola aceti]SCI71921.1 ATP-dependent zinc metalloprotease FtsH [uncultured Flavonifractor sp.]SCI86825.1 ATP-dependent zinc metalloprotease FtsH [uncultured Flavonifractor sp.]
MKRMSSRDLTLYLLVILLMVFAVTSLQQMNRTEAPTYSQIRSYFLQEQVQSFTLKDNTLRLTLRGEGDQTTTVTYEMSDQALTYFYMDMRELIDDQLAAGILESYDYPPGLANSWWYNWLPSLIVLLSVGFLLFVLYRQRMASMGGGGGAPGASRFGHARTKTLSDQGKKVTFDDVAGAEEEKEELQEIVEFLRDPQKFTALGARIPKGVLLVGPPGTGKTLIAKAVAGEAGVHFLSISGSDFVELYVGVGASRVRDLFDQAKKDAPAIVFIDEIDAVGRQRGAGLGGGHDEREQTLNQLLVEMDGFGSNEGVIVMAATNRQDILDPALLRPGRFDRQIYVGLPDIKGREEILKVHAKKKPLAEDVSLNQIARSTAGFTGADLENLLNEAALLAAREDKRFITMSDLHEAMLKVIAGPEKKSRVVTEHARKLTAYHEAGHAVVIHDLDSQDPVHQITIVPRGPAGGMTISLPSEDKAYLSRRELEERIAVCLGGRVAEQLVLGDISTGASSDIQKASQTARAMVTKYGMSDKLGTIAYGNESDEIFIGRSMAQARTYSEEVAGQIDQEVKAIVDRAYTRCEDILTRRRKELDTIAQYLLEHETMDGQEFAKVFEAQA